MPRLRLAVPLACALAAAGCETAPPAPPTPPSGVAVRSLHEPFRTQAGDVYLIRVQDEYRLIRCIPSGPIAGWYEDVFKLRRDQITDDSTSQSGVRWNHWVPVPQVPGLDIMFLSPDRIALREQIAAAPPK